MNHSIFPQISELDDIITSYLDPIFDYPKLIQVNRYYHKKFNKHPVYYDYRMADITLKETVHGKKYQNAIPSLLCMYGLHHLALYVAKQKSLSDLMISMSYLIAFNDFCIHGKLEEAQSLKKFADEHHISLIHKEKNDETFIKTYNKRHFSVARWLTTIFDDYQIIEGSRDLYHPIFDYQGFDYVIL